jgi:hypothetical protein
MIVCTKESVAKKETDGQVDRAPAGAGANEELGQHAAVHAQSKGNKRREGRCLLVSDEHGAPQTEFFLFEAKQNA